MNLEIAVTSHDLSLPVEQLVKEIQPVLEEYFGEAEVIKVNNGNTRGFEKIFPHVFFLTSYEGKVTSELRKHLFKQVSQLITEPYRLSYLGIK